MDSLVQDGLISEENRKTALYRVQLFLEGGEDDGIPEEIHRIVTALIDKGVVAPEMRLEAARELSLRFSTFTKSLMTKFSYHAARGLIRGLNLTEKGDDVVN